MGGKMSRDKGARREREFVHRLHKAGIPAERVPLSGAVGGQFSGDIRFGDGYLAECKARKDGSGFKTVEGWLGDNDFLFLQRDRQEPFVCMSWERFTHLVKEAKRVWRVLDDGRGNSGSPEAR
tara:strand:- start:13942 stop:14310 length:369 start_codon:yes stop_codon:yes gene_type:complete